MKRGILLIILIVLMSSIVSAGIFSGVWQDYFTGRQISVVQRSFSVVASPSELGPGEIVSVTVSASDPRGIDHLRIYYIEGITSPGIVPLFDIKTANTYRCNRLLSCSNTWNFRIDNLGGWVFHGYAVNSDGKDFQYLGYDPNSNTVRVIDDILARPTSGPICGDGICGNFEKQISCSKEYTFEDGLKHEMCWTNSQNCPVDCGRTIGDYDGEKLDAPICGDGKCEGVESKKICKITPGLKQEHCQSACLPDCGVIALNAPKDFSVPIEIPNKNKGPFGFGGSDAYIINEIRVGEIFILIKEPIFRFHRFTSIGECHDYLCLEGVRSDAVDLKVRETSYIDRDLFNLYGIIPPKHKWIVFDNLPYYNHLRIKQSKDSVTYKQFTPIFDGIVEIEYYIDKPPIGKLSGKEMKCIDNVIISKNIKVPEPCEISTLGDDLILSSFSYTQNELAYVRYQCLLTMRRDYINEWVDCMGVFKTLFGEYELITPVVPEKETISS